MSRWRGTRRKASALGTLAVVVLAAICTAVTSAVAQLSVRESPAQVTEFRALWVDGFHAGVRTPQEAHQLVADSKQAGFNVLIVQVRRRGDAYYTQSIEPSVEDPAYDPSYDALKYIIELAHREGIEVHAWVNAMPVWRDAAPPADPHHIFNQHGIGQAGDANWLTASPNGEQKFPVGYFLDGGHPAAADHIAQVCVNLVRHYDLDGIHLDYIRYPETDDSAPKGAPVGYNAVSLKRFRTSTKRTDTPAPDDPQWIAWRQQQITQLVRRIYLETKAVNPRVRVSAAVIPWGKPPSNEKDFEQAAPMQRVFQNWHAWLKEGILDLAIPMNYARDNDSVSREWFNGWIRWEKQHKHGRQLAVGIGGYLNPPDATLAQIERVRHSERGKGAEGVSLFSYAAPQKAVIVPATVSESAVPGRVPANGNFPFDSRAFAAAAIVPKPQWLDHPRFGWIIGTVGADNRPGDGAEVELRQLGWWPFRSTRRVLADGNGVFGYCDLKPGKYQLRLKNGTAAKIEVTAGRVARTQLSLP